MKKYLSLFSISFQQEFSYKVNFVMWRVRNILQIIVVFYLWDSVFINVKGEIFGYSKDKILTYVFLLLFVRAVVLSTRAIDVAGEISNGELNNYLSRPINYVYYWLTRDVSTKVLNLIFAIGETTILYFLLKPPFFLQTSFVTILAFVVIMLLSALLYFLITFMLSLVPFWVPESAWGVHFLFTIVLTQFLSGSLFPIDVLPVTVQKILSFTPFPYLIYYPIQVYLGNVGGIDAWRVVGISLVWLFVFWIILVRVWKKGLLVYQAYGR